MGAAWVWVLARAKWTGLRSPGDKWSGEHRLCRGRARVRKVEGEIPKGQLSVCHNAKTTRLKTSVFLCQEEAHIVSF